MKYFLVTGCAGFIGFHISKKILENGNIVYGIDNINSYYDIKLKNDRLKILKKYKNFHFSKIDLKNKKKLNNFFLTKRYSFYIFHFAAQAGVRYSLKKPSEYVSSNIIGSFNLLECIKNNKKIKKLLFISSSSVYGDSKKLPFDESMSTLAPKQLYAATKICNEYFAQVYSKLFNKKILCLRLFTVYGPWGRPDMALYNFCKNILLKKKIFLFNRGNHKRDFTYIDDLTNSIKNIIRYLDNKKHAKNFEIINFCSQRSVTLKKYIEIIENNLKMKAKKKLLPLQQGDMIKTHGSSKKLKRLLNYECKITPENGIKRYISWFKNYYNF